MDIRLNKLIEQATSGDELAQREVYSLFRKIAIVKYHRKGFTCDMDDYLSAVAEGVWKGLRTFDKSRMTLITPRAWMYINVNSQIAIHFIALNRLKNTINSRALRLDQPIKLSKHNDRNVKYSMLDLINDNRDMESDSVGKLTCQAVLSTLINCLSQLECKALYCRYYGYGIKDTAELLSERYRTVENALGRVRKKAYKLGIREQLA